MAQLVSPVTVLAVVLSRLWGSFVAWGGGMDALSSASSHAMKGFMAACTAIMIVLASSCPVSPMAAPGFGGVFLECGVGDGSAHEGVAGSGIARHPCGVVEGDRHFAA